MILLIVVPATAFFYWRAGPASFDMSIADVSVLAAFPFAVSRVPWGDPRVRRFLGALFVYLLLLLIAVTANPSRRAVFEWMHRIALVGGAAAIGAALASRSLVDRALRIFNVAALVFSLASILATLTNGFEPAYPFGMQKNPAGTIIGIGLLLCVMAPRVSYAVPRFRLATVAVLLGGLLATQSRGAMVALLAVVGLWTIRRRGVRRSAIVTVGMVAAMAAVVLLVNAREEEQVREDPNKAAYTATATRAENVGLAVDRWQDRPITGAGLRYFVGTQEPEPHNVVVSNLAEGGLVGLVALGILLAGAARALRSQRGPLATAARFALAFQFLAALFDVYWRAGTGSLPWLIVGIALIDPDPAGPQPGEHLLKPRVRRSEPMHRVS